MGVLEEWRLRDIEQKADRAVSQLYKLDTFHSSIGSLERAVREMQDLLKTLQNDIQDLQDRVYRLEFPLG